MFELGTSNAGGPDQFAAMSDQLFNILPVMFVIAGIFFTVRVVFFNGDAGGFFKALFGIGMMFGSLLMLRFFLGVPSPEKESPGPLSQAFDWILANALIVSVVVGGLVVAGTVLVRKINRDAKERQVKQDLRDLLAAIDYAEQLAEYWQDQVARDVGVLEKFQHRRLVGDRISTIAAARKTLLDLLDGVHKGYPMALIPRRKFNTAKDSLQRCAKDADGTVVVRQATEPAAVTSTPPNSASTFNAGRPAARARQRTASPAASQVVMVHQHPDVVVVHERPEVVVVEETPIPVGLLDPATQLDPVSVWNFGSVDQSSDGDGSTADDERRCRVDASDTGAGWSVPDTSSSASCDSGGPSDTDSNSYDSDSSSSSDSNSYSTD